MASGGCAWTRRSSGAGTGGLRGVEALDVAGALTAGDAELLAGLPALRELSLQGPGRWRRRRAAPAQEAALAEPARGQRPAARLALAAHGPGGAGLGWRPGRAAGASPPTLHSFRIRAGRWSQLADTWRPLGGYLPLAWVRLHTVGWSRLATIRTVSNLSTLSLAEARALLEVLPCRLPVERLTVGVRESMDALDLCGCRIDVL
ncbi:MAG: hypothetical protein H6744_13595 [Deltaproteobacteria bacterium]|nr:hypothetical protein [Deltaproteobacteria bacterium]